MLSIIIETSGRDTNGKLITGFTSSFDKTGTNQDFVSAKQVVNRHEKWIRKKYGSNLVIRHKAFTGNIQAMIDALDKVTKGVK